jgi:hypothetical protein
VDLLPALRKSLIQDSPDSSHPRLTAKATAPLHLSYRDLYLVEIDDRTWPLSMEADNPGVRAGAEATFTASDLTVG